MPSLLPFCFFMPQAHYSKVLAVPADQVWDLLRDFSALPRWMSFLASCELKDGARPDQVGAVLVITRQDGQVVEETLRELSDHTRRLGFAITKGGAPLRDAYATITVHPVVADGSAYVEWTSTFDADGDAAPLVAWVRDEFMRPCLDELERVLRAKV